jgi:hypothetical protein
MSYVPVKPNSPLAFWQHGQARSKGFGAYESVGDWTWEFDPFAFSFLAPSDSTPQPAPYIKGFGGCGCGGKCGCGDGHKHGVGQAATGVLGTSCFSSSNISSWGICEWGAIAVGLYLTGSVVGDLTTAAQKTKKAARSVQRHQAAAGLGVGGLLAIGLIAFVGYEVYANQPPNAAATTTTP